jgi:hypothetical protein
LTLPRHEAALSVEGPPADDAEHKLRGTVQLREVVARLDDFAARIRNHSRVASRDVDASYPPPPELDAHSAPHAIVHAASSGPVGYWVSQSSLQNAESLKPQERRQLRYSWHTDPGLHGPPQVEATHRSLQSAASASAGPPLSLKSESADSGRESPGPSFPGPSFGDDGDVSSPAAHAAQSTPPPSPVPALSASRSIVASPEPSRPHAFVSGTAIRRLDATATNGLYAPDRPTGDARYSPRHAARKAGRVRKVGACAGEGAHRPCMVHLVTREPDRSGSHCGAAGIAHLPLMH